MELPRDGEAVVGRELARGVQRLLHGLRARGVTRGVRRETLETRILGEKSAGLPRETHRHVVQFVLHPFVGLRARARAPKKNFLSDSTSERERERERDGARARHTLSLSLSLSDDDVDVNRLPDEQTKVRKEEKERYGTRRSLERVPRRACGARRLSSRLSSDRRAPCLWRRARRHRARIRFWVASCSRPTWGAVRGGAAKRRAEPRRSAERGLGFARTVTLGAARRRTLGAARRLWGDASATRRRRVARVSESRKGQSR